MTNADIQASARILGAQEARNRDVVLDYYEKLIGKWDYDAASTHLGAHFIQHNPTIADGLAGLEAFVRGVPPPVAQSMRHRIVRVLVDGDFVMVHGRVTMPGMADTAIVDVFRLENEKVVEHWDVMQSVPTEAMHRNEMV